jgi:hypothetical protein
MSTTAETVKLLPGAVSRTDPGVTISLSVPLKAAQLPYCGIHQLMFEAAAGCTPMVSSAVVPVRSSRGHQLTGSGTDAVAGLADCGGAAVAGLADCRGDAVTDPVDCGGAGGLPATAVFAAAVGAAGCVLAALWDAADALALGATFLAPETAGEADDVSATGLRRVPPPESVAAATTATATTTMTAAMPPSTHGGFHCILRRGGRGDPLYRMSGRNPLESTPPFVVNFHVATGAVPLMRIHAVVAEAKRARSAAV